MTMSAQPLFGAAPQVEVQPEVQAGQGLQASSRLDSPMKSPDMQYRRRNDSQSVDTAGWSPKWVRWSRPSGSSSEAAGSAQRKICLALLSNEVFRPGHARELLYAPPLRLRDPARFLGGRRRGCRIRPAGTSPMRYCTKFWISGTCSSMDRSRGVLPSSAAPTPSRIPQSRGSWSVTHVGAAAAAVDLGLSRNRGCPAGSSELPACKQSACRARSSAPRGPFGRGPAG